MTEDTGARMSSEDSSVSNSNSQTRQRKKRRWDQPAESLESAGLAVPGVLPLPNGVFPPVLQGPSIPQQPAASAQKINQLKLQEELIIAREIVINDAESSVRYKLTKRQTQEEIQKCTGAVVITRGKYRPPKAPADGEKPLYLHISAAAHLKDTAERILAVDRAAAMIEEMLKLGQSSQQALANIANGEKVGQAFSACVFLGFDADSSLNIISRIRGPDDQYVNHIMNETGATVLLRGCGSGHVEISSVEDGEQPLHLFLSSSNSKSLEDAKLLAENLLDTISAECGASRVSSCKVYSAVPPPQQVYNAVPPPQQVYGGISSMQQVYSAVPPPQQLLGEVQSVRSEQKAATISTAVLTSSMPGSIIPVPPMTLVGVPGVASVQGTSLAPGGLINGNQIQENTIGYRPPSISSCTSYVGYEGIYPQATPLQQVALALRHSIPVASTTPPTTILPVMDSKPKVNSELVKEKRPSQRRKFQELPAVADNPPKANQGSDFLKPLMPPSSSSFRNASNIPAPKKLANQSANENGMRPPPPKSMAPPPPPSRSMPPPPRPPKFSSSTSNAKDAKCKVQLSKTISNGVPDTLVKLMEYGDEDDDLEDTTGDADSLGLNPIPTSTKKPFWAL